MISTSVKHMTMIDFFWGDIKFQFEYTPLLYDFLLHYFYFYIIYFLSPQASSV